MGSTEKTSEGLKPGDAAPDFSLVSTTGDVHSLPAAGEAPASVVVWTCNHCPYAIGWHERLLAVAAEYTARGVPFFFINSNDADRYPADSLEAMRDRVEREGGWAAPYLFDESQAVAADYGAKTTPDVYVLESDLKVAYRGAPDSDYLDESKNAAWMRDALDAVLSGDEPELQLSESVGCSIKWKP